MGNVLGADAWGLRPLARAGRGALPDGLTLHVEMLRLAVMFRRSGHRQIKQALETGMAGEIRDALAVLKKARDDMVAEMTKRIGATTQKAIAIKADGIKALDLPAAELAAYEAEIREIHADFAALTNGGPTGPLPNSGAAAASSAQPSQASADGKSDGIGS